MKEIWTPIRGYARRYEVSSLGRIRSLARMTVWGQVIPQRILKLDVSRRTMHAAITLSKNSVTKRFMVGRLVLENFTQRWPRSKFECQFIDGDCTNAKLLNLHWGTPEENGVRKSRSGIMPSGDNNPSAVLNSFQVREIRTKHRLDHWSYRRLAMYFEVSERLVEKIVKNRLWRRIPE